MTNESSHSFVAVGSDTSDASSDISVMAVITGRRKYKSFGIHAVLLPCHSNSHRQHAMHV